MYANALSQFGDHQKAAEIIESASETLDVLSSPYKIWAKETLALIYSRLNRLQEAAELREQNLESSINVYGLKHRETIKARVSLAWSYEKLDRPQDGIEILADVVSSARNTYGTDDPETIRHVERLNRMLARHEGEEAKKATEASAPSESSFSNRWTLKRLIQRRQRA